MQTVEKLNNWLVDSVPCVSLCSLLLLVSHAHAGRNHFHGSTNDDFLYSFLTFWAKKKKSNVNHDSFWIWASLSCAHIIRGLLSLLNAFLRNLVGFFFFFYFLIIYLEQFIWFHLIYLFYIQYYIFYFFNICFCSINVFN